MNLSKNNIFAIYYKWIYGELPNDICSMFWGSVFGILLFFILIPGRFITSNSTGEKVAAGILFWACYLVSLLFGHIFIDIFKYEYTNLWGHLLLAPVIGAAGLTLLIGVWYGIVHVAINKAPNSKPAQNVLDIVGAIRRKHCTKINWK